MLDLIALAVAAAGTLGVGGKVAVDKLGTPKKQNTGGNSDMSGGTDPHSRIQDRIYYYLNGHATPAEKQAFANYLEHYILQYIQAFVEMSAQDQINLLKAGIFVFVTNQLGINNGGFRWD